MNTVLLIFLPLLFIPLVAAFGNERAKWLALLSSLVTLGLQVGLLCQYSSGQAIGVDAAWIPSLGIRFTVAVDGISMLMLLLTNILTPIIILATATRAIERQRLFYSLVLLTQVAFNGVFMATDAFLFYIFWELALIPIYFIVLLWGKKETRVAITYKFFIYTLIGSMFMLSGFIIMYLQTPGQHSFSLQSLLSLQLPAEQQSWIFWLLFLGFAIKVPLFLLHGWQADTYTDSSTGGTMLLAGIMSKMGVYGLVRWVLPLAPLGAQEWQTVVIVLACIGVVYASLVAIAQKDMKRMIAYSSLAHLGMIVAGIFSFTQQGIQGAVIQSFNHGLLLVGLLFVADIIEDRTKTRQLDSLGGIARNAQVLAICFMVLLLGGVALPSTNGFVGEVLLMIGVYKYSAWLAAFAGLSIILGAVYMLRAYQRSMLGEASTTTAGFADIKGKELVVFVPLVAIIIVFGVYPKPILGMLEGASLQLSQLFAAL